MELTHPLNRTEFGSPDNLGNLMSEHQAMDLLRDWVKNEKLLFHMQQVGHLLKKFAESKALEQEERHMWHLSGLLHDADWDQWPDEHCKKIIEELEARNQDPRMIKAIASHGPRYFGVDPVSELDKMLYAFDELSGFVHAYSLMRPQGYDGMEIKGVKKRLKDKSFAAQVSRDDISDASQRAGIPVEDLIQFVIDNQLRA
ncbi:Predicted hydrolase, HD superfamily [Belliella buryatensis]|uniref:Predicted hydrolase, HD superfamily n=1 Tax=Belliella buryatensis TaxID=1500549 RepID=A0A239G170_9BACT|nr:hydrolase [Belliella buryatensis]SNS62438.1 Predicted hydrolase, HD superfamily [Belliella buryatensis]